MPIHDQFTWMGIFLSCPTNVYQMNVTADWIKVDHSFVSQVAHSDFDQALTESLINLCKRVCVEGIETKEIEKVIQGYQPSTMQGYWFSKPLEVKRFEELYIIPAEK